MRRHRSNQRIGSGEEPLQIVFVRRPTDVLRMSIVSGLAILTTLMCVLAPTMANAQQPQDRPRTGPENEELAKKLSNPISDLVSVPFQFNWYQNVGPLELSRFILNVQPVIPLELNDHWNL